MKIRKAWARLWRPLTALAWLGVGAALVAPAGAQPAPPAQSARPAPPVPPRDAALAPAFEATWQRTLAAAESQAQQQRASAEQQAARRLWAAPPALELSHRDDRLGRNRGQQETEIAFAWPLWLPGQRAARGAAGDTLLRQADAAREAARLRVASELREAFWALAAQRGEVRWAEARAQSLERLAADVERRVRAGDLARADALAARAEWLTARTQVAEAALGVQQAQARWRLLTGLEEEPPPNPAAGSSVRAEVSPPAVADAQDLPAAHPELRLAEATIEAAQAEADVARGSRGEPPELTLGVRQDRGARGEAARPSVGVALRWPLGAVDAYQPREAAALAELERARTVLARTRERLLAELSAARGSVALVQQRLDTQRDRAALLRERATLIDQSFRAGESALPDLLRALASAAEAEAATERDEAALGQTQARVLQTLGITP